MTRPRARKRGVHLLPSNTLAAVPAPRAAVLAWPSALSFEIICFGFSAGRPFLAAAALAAASAACRLLISACLALAAASFCSFCWLIAACRALRAAASASRRLLISACCARAAAAGSGFLACAGGCAALAAGAAGAGRAGAARGVAAGDGLAAGFAFLSSAASAAYCREKSISALAKGI